MRFSKIFIYSFIACVMVNSSVLLSNSEILSILTDYNDALQNLKNEHKVNSMLIIRTIKKSQNNYIKDTSSFFLFDKHSRYQSKSKILCFDKWTIYNINLEKQKISINNATINSKFPLIQYLFDFSNLKVSNRNDSSIVLIKQLSNPKIPLASNYCTYYFDRNSKLLKRIDYFYGSLKENEFNLSIEYRKIDLTFSSYDSLILNKNEIPFNLKGFSLNDERNN